MSYVHCGCVSAVFLAGASVKDVVVEDPAARSRAVVESEEASFSLCGNTSRRSTAATSVRYETQPWAGDQ